MSLFDWFEKLVKKAERAAGKPDYPDTVEEVLDDNLKYRKETSAAIIKFKKSKPWKGTKEEVQAKLRTLNSELAEIYGIEPPQVVFVRRFAYGCCYFPIGNLIIMEHEKDGRYSVVTFLHEFGHALGKGERATCKWSINLFRKHFPKSYAKLVPKGHLLYLPKKEKKDDSSTASDITPNKDGKGTDVSGTDTKPV